MKRVTERGNDGNIVLYGAFVLNQSGISSEDAAEINVADILCKLETNLFDNFESRLSCDSEGLTHPNADGYPISYEREAIIMERGIVTYEESVEIIRSLAEEIFKYEERFSTDTINISDDAIKNILNVLRTVNSEIENEEDYLEDPVTEGYARCVNDIRTELRNNNVGDAAYNVIITRLRQFLHILEQKYFESEEDEEYDYPVAEGYAKCIADFCSITSLNKAE